ncbi:MAG: glycosyltransferase family 4 protein [Armatimonadota bacterium]|jgi:phosphatidylinositol alpha-1,6-mannosyltransferase
MSVIFLADDFPPALGGIQTYACELARATAELGEEVAVVASRQEGAEAVDAGLPFEIIRVPTRGSYPMAAMNLSAGAQQAAQRLNSPPRALVATKWSPEGPGAILAFGQLRCPLVLIGYGGEFSHTGGNLLKWLMQRVVRRRMAACFAISHFTAELFAKAGVPRERISIIFGGVRPENYAVTDERVGEVRGEVGLGDAPVLLTASRLVERKGHDTVMRALPRVLERFADLIWLIAGEGPTAEALAALADEAGVADRVRFLGRVDDERLAALYAAADLYVMPSRPVRGALPEGLGLVYLEAAAAGTPSVATRFGGIPDAVADGETGLLVPPDEPDALADAIIELLGDDARRAAMGEAARERVLSEFTWARVAERFLDHLATLESGGRQ